MPGLTIGDTVPNLELDSTHGKIRIHDYVGDGYAIIFSHPGTIRSFHARTRILCPSLY
jgi:alkyl hydroperoxide reductase subunit AhpC